MLRYSFIVFIIVLFNACSGGGGSSGTTEQNPTSTSSISGTAIDGYISGATVCLDINNNGSCDTDEPRTTTNPDGTYLFTTSYIGTVPLLVLGGTDTATNKTFKGILKRKISITSNSSHSSKNITPLTTIAGEVSDNEIDILAQYLGLTKDDLDKDPMKDTKLFIKSQQIYQTSKDIAKLKNLDFKDVIKLVAQSIKENNSTNEINITDISMKLPSTLDTKHIQYLTTQNNEINESVSSESNPSNLANLQKIQDDKNTAPFISGTPSLIAFLNSNYSFTPTANDMDDDDLTFSISNKPSWATFNSSTRQLSGIPTLDGNFSDINISVFDGIDTSH